MTKYKFPCGQIRIPACAGMTDGNGARTFAGIFYVSILILFLMRYSKKIGCAGCFYFSDDLKSTAVNPICFSNRLQPQNLLQPAPSPVGEGRGEGIFQVAATFPNTLTAPIQALRLVALSLALSHRERGRVGCW
ncbi:hypothetical protein ACOV7F_002043, partial [Neisseria gonorrhoeae]